MEREEFWLEWVKERKGDEEFDPGNIDNVMQSFPEKGKREMESQPEKDMRQWRVSFCFF